MLYNFKEFISLNEKANVASLIKDILDNMTDLEKKNELLRIISKYTYNYNKRKSGYNIDDLVLIEYWYNGMITPVKILEKKGNKFVVSHNIPDSKIKNAPNQELLKQDILDFYLRDNSDLKYNDVDPSLAIDNSINKLPTIDQNLLYKEIKSTLESSDILEDSNVDDVNTEQVSSMSNDLMGKNGFNSFLKILSALNISNDLEKRTTNIETNFSHLYVLDNINKDRLVQILNRFNSMNTIVPVVQKANRIGLYFGVKFSAQTLFIQYGVIINNDEYKEIGEFLFTKKVIDEISQSNNPYLKDFKKDVSYFTDINLLKKLCVLKEEISNFSPAFYIKKTAAFVENDYLKISFHGVGKWDGGVMLADDLKAVKKEFNSWILKSKYRKNVVFSIKPNNFWITFKIKISD